MNPQVEPGANRKSRWWSACECPGEGIEDHPGGVRGRTGSGPRGGKRLIVFGGGELGAWGLGDGG